MSRLSKFFGSQKSRTRFNQPKPRRFESLERREMMSVTPLFYASAVQPMRSEQVTVATFPDVSTTGDSFSVPVPAFSSRPGAPATIYLDFDGHFQDVPAVGNQPNVFSPAFAVDDNGANWDFEASSIKEIWARVAEDYAPFNVNVTTVDPGDFSHGSKNLRVVITGEDFRSDSDAGGVAHLNSFTKADKPNVAYVFTKSKGFEPETDPAGFRTIKAIANLVSHEAGHAFGVDHQSLYKDGKLIEEYNPGDDKKAPIMGNANSSERGIWWVGKTDDGVMQDDMAVIGRADNGFGFRPDENNISFAEPEQLQYLNGELVGHGIINRANDVDVFRFDTFGGKIEVFVEPARVVPGDINSPMIGNLDAVIELFDNKGNLLARGDDPNSITAAITVNGLPASNYFIKVRSQALNVGDVGQFRLSVTEADPPRVVSTSLTTVGSNLGVWIQFNKPIKADSFTTADVGASGVSVLSVTPDANDPRRFLVTVTATSAPYWTLSIGPNIHDQKFGNQKMDQNRDGTQGGTADVFRATFINPNLPTLELATTTTSPTKKTNLTPKLVDAAYSL